MGAVGNRTGSGTTVGPILNRPMGPLKPDIAPLGIVEPFPDCLGRLLELVLKYQMGVIILDDDSALIGKLKVSIVEVQTVGINRSEVFVGFAGGVHPHRVCLHGFECLAGEEGIGVPTGGFCHGILQETVDEVDV